MDRHPNCHQKPIDWSNWATPHPSRKFIKIAETFCKILAFALSANVNESGKMIHGSDCSAPRRTSNFYVTVTICP